MGKSFIEIRIFIAFANIRHSAQLYTKLTVTICCHTNSTEKLSYFQIFLSVNSLLSECIDYSDFPMRYNSVFLFSNKLSLKCYLYICFVCWQRKLYWYFKPVEHQMSCLTCGGIIYFLFLNCLIVFFCQRFFFLLRSKNWFAFNWIKDGSLISSKKLFLEKAKSICISLLYVMIVVLKRFKISTVIKRSWMYI